MRDDPNNLSCTAFQEMLPELIGTGVDITLHPHLRSCETCRALIADLETIAEAARQLLPIVEPPEALWERIELAIKMDDKLAE
jgi:predicted anti-sigma-YlaC factor YlaD